MLRYLLRKEKYIDFELLKPELKIINIDEIMAESDGISKIEFGTYMPDCEPMEKEKRKLVVIQERH